MTPMTAGGLPAEPGEAFDLLSDLVVNMLTLAHRDPTVRDALVSRAVTLCEDIEDEVEKIEMAVPPWWGRSGIAVPAVPRR